MHFMGVLAHLKSKLFSVGQPWWLTLFHPSNLLKSHVPSGTASSCVPPRYYLCTKTAT